MYNMAKTVMLSNEAYEKLRSQKDFDPNASYSEIVLSLIERKEGRKTMRGLKECFGILKGDKEYDEVMKKVKRGWARWTKKYA